MALEMFPGTLGGNQNGVVNKEDWWQTGLERVMMTQNDDLVCKQIEDAWGICEDEDAAVHRTEAMRVVALMR